MGRVNFAPDLGEHKGITGGVRLGFRWINGWKSTALDVDRLDRIAWSPLPAKGVGPAFFRGSFDVAEPADTFLGLRSWTKGVAWVNGFCLGRYWETGPHRSLYVPGPLLRKGENEVVILELHPAADRRPTTVELRASHDIDG
jgi:beta-galactosidase